MTGPRKLIDMADEIRDAVERQEKRGRGRPRIGPVVEVRLPDDILATIDQCAEVNDMTRAEIIREAIEAFFED